MATLVLARIDAGAVVQEARRLRRNLTDLRPAFEKGATRMRRSFAENFAQGGRPAWRPLTANTVISKAYHGGPQGISVAYATSRGIGRVRRLEQSGSRSMTGILIYGGQLRDSYAQKNRDHISRVRKDGFEEGSKHWLAFWHEWGTSPYMIYPRFSRALRFMTARGFAMASKVRHPGLPARPTAIYQDEDIDFIMELLMREVDRG